MENEDDPDKVVQLCDHDPEAKKARASVDAWFSANPPNESFEDHPASAKIDKSGKNAPPRNGVRNAISILLRLVSLALAILLTVPLVWWEQATPNQLIVLVCTIILLLTVSIRRRWFDLVGDTWLHKVGSPRD